MEKRIVILAIVTGSMLAAGGFLYYVGIPAFVRHQITVIAQASPLRSVAGEGEYKGAAYCGVCHSKQMNEWRESLHAKATTEKLYEPRYQELNWAMPREQCESCHAPATPRAEGVGCEVCHGPGRTEKMARNVCLGCHQINAAAPSMEPLSTGREFALSAAATVGLDCVGCHMSAADGTVSHRFRGSRTAPEAYAGVAAIQSVVRKEGKLVIAVGNHIAGHFLPTGAPENVVFLTVVGFSGQGQAVYAEEYRFEKRMFRFRHMPMFTIADTRLRDGETRVLEFTVPQTPRVEITLSIRPVLWTGETAEQVIDRYVGEGR